MSTDHHDQDDLASTLARDLQQRVEGMQEAPYTFADITARASSIRRRRLVAAAAAVAAAVAIIVPAALLPGRGLDRADSPPPAGQTTPTSTASPAPVLAPATSYLEGRRLIRPGREPLDLRQEYDEFALIGDRVLAVRSDNDGNRRLDILDATGAVTDSKAILGDVAVNDAHTTAAWGTPAGTIETLWADGSVQLADVGGTVSAKAVRGDGSCHEEDGGCRVWFDGEFGQAPRSADSHGIVDEFAPGAIGVDDVSVTGIAAVQLSFSDEGSCSGVHDEQQGGYLWRTCDYSLLEFSPDGRLLLATDAYQDGFSLNYVTVLDTATGDPIVRFDGSILSQAWEDGDHVLVVVATGNNRSVLRLGVDGAREVVAGPTPITREDTPVYVLGQ